MKKYGWATLALLLLQGVSTPLFAAQPAHGQVTYICETPDGKLISSDRPIRECWNKEQRIVNSNGTTVGTLRPLSEIKKEEEAAARLQIEAQMRARLNAEGDSLLKMYPTAKSHDDKRRAYLLPLVEKLESTNQQIEQVNAQLADGSKPATVKGATATQTQERRERLERDLAVQEHIATTLRKQIAAINKTFDEEKVLLAPLWQPASHR